MTFRISSLLVLLSLLAGHVTAAPKDSREKTIKDSIKTLYAPDGRTEQFDITVSVAENNAKDITLKGKSSTQTGVETLILAYKKNGYSVTNEITMLPDVANLGENIWGVVKNSVCNMRGESDYDARAVSQAQMGMPVRILYNEDGWLRVQTPDRYLGFVQQSAIRRLTKAELEQWNGAPKIIITALWGQVFEKPDINSQPMGDVVAGNRMKHISTKGKFFKVEFPDGRQGYLSKKVGKEEAQWRKELSFDPKDILKTAFSFYGTPYVWSGMSPKGSDCSGFVRATLLLHDITIPRDCSQMCKKGQRIEIGDFSNLLPGDLLLFGSRNQTTGKERASHVGFYIGDKRFIHSLGNVHEGSFNPDDAELYDEYNLGRLLFAIRILPFINKEDELNTTDKNPFYSSKLNF